MNLRNELLSFLDFVSGLYAMYFGCFVVRFKSQLQKKATAMLLHYLDIFGLQLKIG